MTYNFKYEMCGEEVVDRYCCSPEEFSEVCRDIQRNGGKDFELISMECDDASYKIQISNGWECFDYLEGLTETEAIEICQDNGWRYYDENGFEWCMDYVEDW